MEQTEKEPPNLESYAFGMFGSSLLWFIANAQTAPALLLAILFGGVLPFVLGLRLLSRAWARSCPSRVRMWSGLWLIFCGLAGAYSGYSMAYANIGSPTRSGYALIRTQVEAMVTILLFGGVIFVFLGLTLMIRTGVLWNKTRRSP